MMSIRLPRKLIDRVDEWAKLNDISRSEAMRRLIEHSLPQEARRPSGGAGK
jgi:metal-responsive CopG/Arc/MetJ family transcriptional regulator